MTILNTSRGAFNVVVDGHRDSPVMMLSNSLGTTHRMWDLQIAALAGQFCVLRHDTRGHGESVVTAGPCRIADLAEDALAILDSLEMDQVHFCGLSMGGMVGLHLAMHATSRIKRLVVANSAAQIAPAQLWDDRIATVRRDGMASIADGIARRWFTADFIRDASRQVESIKRMIIDTPLEGYVSCCAAVRDFDVRELMGVISLPVMVIAGEFDPATPAPSTSRIAEAIVGSRLESLPAAHLSNIECSREFNRLLNDFCK